VRGFDRFNLTDHAKDEMRRRGLSDVLVESVIRNPEQRIEVRAGRAILQSIVLMGSPPTKFIVRVVIDVDRSPPDVVTAYRSSKIEKYWEHS
jgi:hypothetical protein